MSKDATWPLEKSLVEYLKADPAVRASLGTPPKIYDQTGTPECYPHLSLGDSVTRSWASATFDGQEHDLILDLSTAEGGSGESKRIAGAIIDALHDADFPVPGHALVDLQFESSETRYIEERGLFHCRLRFKALTVSD